MTATLRFYALVAAVVLAATTFVWFQADEESGTLLTISGVLFWVAGLALIAIGVLAIARRR